jgi:hypothetical protein
MVFHSEATPHFSLRAVGPTGRRQGRILVLLAPRGLEQSHRPGRWILYCHVSKTSLRKSLLPWMCAMVSWAH